MKGRTLGRSGLLVSELGFGCGPTAGLMTGENESLRVRAVARALELGITYFDTAPGYGSGRSEMHLGRALRELAARPVVATKVTLEANDLQDITGAVRRSVETSLARLQLERLDVVHLHNRFGAARSPRAPFGSGALLTADDAIGPRGVAAALEELRAQGLVGVIGCCAFGGEPAAVRRVITSGRFESVIVNYSLLNATAWSPTRVGRGTRNYEQVAHTAAEQGMGVIALRVLEGGVLTGRAPPVRPDPGLSPERRADLERAARLTHLLESADEDLAHLAIRFALSNERVANVLIGFSDIAQIETAVAAANAGPLPHETLERIESLRARDFDVPAGLH